MDLANRSLTKLYKKKWTVQHRRAEQHMHQDRLGHDRQNSDPEEKGMHVMRDAI